MQSQLALLAEMLSLEVIRTVRRDGDSPVSPVEFFHWRELVSLPFKIASGL